MPDKKEKITGKIQLKVPDSLWENFKSTVPMTKTTHEIICELLQKRVEEHERNEKILAKART